MDDQLTSGIAPEMSAAPEEMEGFALALALSCSELISGEELIGIYSSLKALLQSN